MRREADVPVARTAGEGGSGLLGAFKDVGGGLVNGGGVSAKRIMPFTGMNAPGAKLNSLSMVFHRIGKGS